MKRLVTLTLCIPVLLVALAACGGASNQTSATAAPTNTTIPTYSFEQPTAAPSVATAAATLVASSSSGELNPEAVEKGKGRYEALECGSCHGANAEGTDKGSSLVTYTAEEADFISFMRSGGELGSDHQYSTNRLSETGGKNLYQYLLSLRAS